MNRCGSKKCRINRYGIDTCNLDSARFEDLDAEAEHCGFIQVNDRYLMWKYEVGYKDLKCGNCLNYQGDTHGFCTKERDFGLRGNARYSGAGACKEFKKKTDAESNGKEGSGMGKKVNRKPNDQLHDLTQQLRNSLGSWQSLFECGGSDPFWEDGANLNLLRNHIFAEKRAIKALCDEHALELPEEYGIETPPEMPGDYMVKARICRGVLMEATKDKPVEESQAEEPEDDQAEEPEEAPAWKPHCPYLAGIGEEHIVCAVGSRHICDEHCGSKSNLKEMLRECNGDFEICANYEKGFEMEKDMEDRGCIACCNNTWHRGLKPGENGQKVCFCQIKQKAMPHHDKCEWYNKIYRETEGETVKEELIADQGEYTLIDRAEEETAVTTQEETSVSAFDYGTMDTETAEYLQSKARVITEIRIKSVIAIGRELVDVHEKLANNKNGVFGAWCKSIGISTDTASN